jgi:hypothetical protein
MAFAILVDVPIILATPPQICTSFFYCGYVAREGEGIDMLIHGRWGYLNPILPARRVAPNGSLAYEPAL